MSPAEHRPLANTPIDHIALSVADLDTMIAFYTRIGFDEQTQSDLAPAPVRVALLRNQAGVGIELTTHEASVAAAKAQSPVDAATQQGPYHFALHVEHLDPTIAAILTAGAKLIIPPSTNSHETARYAYIADPEGNLVELTSPSRPSTHTNTCAEYSTRTASRTSLPPGKQACS